MLKLVAEGRTSKEVARMLGLFPSTIYMYRSRIMAKLGLRGLPALMGIALRFGLIDLRTNDVPHKGDGR